MGQTTEGADTVHRVKRGRPAKAVALAKSEDVLHDSDCSLHNEPAYPAEPCDCTIAAQAYALRIWDGQSVDVSIPERVERVVNGLRGQKLSIDVNLPHPDAARFLAKHQ